MVTARALPGRPRSGLWALSAFVVVLVALAHVLGCASHGQSSPFTGRAYALPVSAPQGPGHDTTPECREPAETGVTAARTDLAAPAPDGELPPPPAVVDAALVRPPADAPWAAAGQGRDVGRLRSALGVWRT
ncbi:hypothetical protein GCM10018779_13440 [Streptomyces griseocarneus]|nr:hypothetical protein GCM10018779_13440 [Streptomyces griseocarneus]